MIFSELSADITIYIFSFSLINAFINVNSKERIVNARDQEEDSAPPMVVIPYVSGLSEDIRRVCSRYDIRVVFRSGLTAIPAIEPEGQVAHTNEIGGGI